MSSASEMETPSSCDQLLDYAYGDLTGEAAASFVAHLAGCPRCQAELEAIGRVRSAVKEALPVEEPPAISLGAQHAQLMHVAARRKPRGVIVPLFRRLAHPGYAAAAGVILIGGVFLKMASHGMMMPAAKDESAAVAWSAPPAPPGAEAVRPMGKADPDTAKTLAAPAAPAARAAPAVSPAATVATPLPMDTASSRRDEAPVAKKSARGHEDVQSELLGGLKDSGAGPKAGFKEEQLDRRPAKNTSIELDSPATGRMQVKDNRQEFSQPPPGYQNAPTQAAPVVPKAAPAPAAEPAQVRSRALDDEAEKNSNLKPSVAQNFAGGLSGKNAQVSQHKSDADALAAQGKCREALALYDQLMTPEAERKAYQRCIATEQRLAQQNSLAEKSSTAKHSKAKLQNQRKGASGVDDSNAATPAAEAPVPGSQK